jgi:hypothetical protein
VVHEIRHLCSWFASTQNTTRKCTPKNEVLPALEQKTPTRIWFWLALRLTWPFDCGTLSWYIFRYDVDKNILIWFVNKNKIICFKNQLATACFIFWNFPQLWFRWSDVLRCHYTVYSINRIVIFSVIVSLNDLDVHLMSFSLFDGTIRTVLDLLAGISTPVSSSQPSLNSWRENK